MHTEKWDAIVRSFRNYDVYWLSGYVKAFQIHGDGEPLLFYYEDTTTRGINVVMKRDVAEDIHFSGLIPEGKYFDFATPYGYGGWLIEGVKTETLFKSYEEWMKKNSIISEFVRFHPMLNNHEACSSFYDVVQLGEVVHMELVSKEGIWDNLTSKNRNMIRKAIKNGIVIKNGSNPSIYASFSEIYNKTMDRNEAERCYYFEKEFYDSLLNDLSENAQVFWAEKDGQIIAASIMLTANGRMNYHLSGSLSEFNSFAPTNLLLYKAALWGNENGYSVLYLGGGVNSKEDGLLKFKKSFFKGELKHFFVGKKIISSEDYNKLIDMREINGDGFFPLYRTK